MSKGQGVDFPPSMWQRTQKVLDAATDFVDQHPVLWLGCFLVVPVWALAALFCWATLMGRERALRTSLIWPIYQYRDAQNKKRARAAIDRHPRPEQ